MSLKARVAVRCVISLAVAMAFLFLPAWTLKFWPAWLLLGMVFLPMFFFSAYFYKHDPALTERRLQGREQIGEQRIIMRLASILMFACLVLPGLDCRFGWSRRLLGPEPMWLMIGAAILFLAGYLLTYRVMQVNSYASRTVQVAAGQQVITTGPYRVVRHPMYSGGLLTLVLAPLVLASPVTLPAFALLIPAIVLRLLNEEKLLRQELAGYSDYCEKTRYRLIPYVW